MASLPVLSESVLAKTRQSRKTASKSDAKKKASKKPPVADSSRTAFFRRSIRWLLMVLMVLILIPLILSLIYRFEGTKPISTTMFVRYVTGKSVERQWVPLESIAPVLIHSVVMSEDGQFCRHDGVDWGELNAVVEDALDGEETRGASTVTMQTAKNLFLWNSRSYVRKAMELPIALWLDLVLSKQRILEIYLNIAEWGEGVFGAEEASQTYFHRSASRLSRRQAALLTTALPNPLNRNAAKPSRRHKRVARIVERRARIAGEYVKCLRKP